MHDEAEADEYREFSDRAGPSKGAHFLTKEQLLYRIDILSDIKWRHRLGINRKQAETTIARYRQDLRYRRDPKETR